PREEHPVLPPDPLQRLVHEGVDVGADAPLQERVDAVHHLVEALDDALEVELLLALRPLLLPPPARRGASPGCPRRSPPSPIIAHSSRQVSRFERYAPWQICSIVARPFAC